MKRVGKHIIIVGMVLMGSSASWAQYGGGNGTQDVPYLLYTFDHLKILAETTGDYGKCFKLMNDLAWNPAVQTVRIRNSFSGRFDGNGHVISGFTYHGVDDYVGLFGQIQNQGVVKNLGLVNVSVVGNKYVGALSGSNFGTINACFVTGSVEGHMYVGGLVGNNYGTVRWSYSHAHVRGQKYAGGLIGYHPSYRSKTQSCFSTGTVKGIDASSNSLGGLLGYLSSGIVTGCFWDQQTSGMETGGGGTGKTTEQMQSLETFLEAGWSFYDIARKQVGVWIMPEHGAYPTLSWQSESEIEPPEFSEGMGSSNDPYVVTSSEAFVQIGKHLDLLDKCYILEDDIDLAGADFWGIGNAVHPFVGQFNGQGHTISNVSWQVADQNNVGVFNVIGSEGQVLGLGLTDVTVQGNQQVGALAGINHGTVFQCFTSGQVQGREQIGGLVGLNEGRIDQCYSLAQVNADTIAGGLVGYNRVMLRDCYSQGLVSSGVYGAGLAGENRGTIETCYAAGWVEVRDVNEGAGLCAINTGSVQNSFWDTQTTGQMTSAAGQGLPTEALVQPETYIHWHDGTEAIWTLAQGQAYPHLAWEQVEGESVPAYRISDFMVGSGTRQDPYVVADAVQLNVIGRFSEAWDRAFELIADVNLVDTKDQDFNRIGLSESQAFTGLFEGNGYCITHVTFQYVPSDDVGMFGSIGPEGQVENLCLDHAVMRGNHRVAALAGINLGTLTNCHVQGDVAGDAFVGGLAGVNEGVVMRCSARGQVQGGVRVGGLLGQNETGEVCNCYATTSVSGETRTGGLVGDLYDSILTHCYSIGHVEHITWDQRSLVGPYRPSVAKHCFWDVDHSPLIPYDRKGGKTQAQMQAMSLYRDASWDIDYATPEANTIWLMPMEPNTYPELNTTWHPEVDLPVFSGGEGTPGSPYLVVTPEDLMSLVQIPGALACHFLMTNDIDLAGIELGTIGAQGVPFNGVFDGNGYRISNFTYNQPTDFEGLFSYIGRLGIVRNLGLTDVHVTGNSYMGAVAGLHLGTIQCCFTTGQVTAETAPNGLAAWGRGKVNNSFSFVETTAVPSNPPTSGSGGGSGSGR